MMNDALFLRLLPYDDKGLILAKTIAEIHSGRNFNSVIYLLNPASFQQIPGSPFAYWASNLIQKLFIELPPLGNEARPVRVGLQTSDDFRFVRLQWEVKPESIVTGTSQTSLEQFHQQTFLADDGFLLLKEVPIHRIIPIYISL